MKNPLDISDRTTEPHERVDRDELAHPGPEQPLQFGEYMVKQGYITRFQLLRALQMQDRYPDARLGECIAALGYVPYHEVQELYDEWDRLALIEVE